MLIERIRARGWSRLASEDAEFEEVDDDDFLSDPPPTRDESTPFLFKKLVPELKNIIYRYLVTPDHGEPMSVTRPSSRRSQISTAILYVDREIYLEASAILYTYNTLQINFNHPAGQILRKDEQVGGTRRLRNGRLSGSTKFTGIIYPHVLRRFNKVYLDLQVHVYGLSMPGPLVSEIWGLAYLRELLEAVSSEDPAQKGSACKTLQLKVTETYYLHRFMGILHVVASQPVVPQIEQYGFPNIFDKIRETRKLVLMEGLCVDSTATLINRIIGRGRQVPALCDS